MASVPINLLIVEDHPPMRAALADLMRHIHPSLEILEAGSAARALELARRHAPRLVLLDIGLPDANGLDLIGELRGAGERCSVVVVSQHSAPAYVERALAAGASAYVEKSNVRHDLLPAITRALEEIAS